MKLLFFTLLLSSFTAQAVSPFMTTKERLRLHLWVYGLESDQAVSQDKRPKKPLLPEEIERTLRKI